MGVPVLRRLTWVSLRLLVTARLEKPDLSVNLLAFCSRDSAAHPCSLPSFPPSASAITYQTWSLAAQRILGRATRPRESSDAWLTTSCLLHGNVSVTLLRVQGGPSTAFACL